MSGMEISNVFTNCIHRNEIFEGSIKESTLGEGAFLHGITSAAMDGLKLQKQLSVILVREKE